MINRQRVFVNTNTEQNLNFYDLLKQETRQFCLNTSIHGCKYIAQTDKSVITR